MFASSNFDIAQSPCINLHCPTSFVSDGGQSSDMALRWVVNVVGATPCSTKLKDSSMHAFFAWVLLETLIQRDISLYKH